MSLSALLCRVPVQPIQSGLLLERISSRKVGGTRTTQLSNGLQVMTARGLGPHASVGFYTPGGSRWERNSVGGKRGVAAVTQTMLQTDLRDRGYIVNGKAEREEASVRLSVRASDVKTAVAELAKTITRPAPDTQTLARACAVVHNESAALHRHAFWTLRDMSLSAAYEGSPLGNSPYPHNTAALGAITSGDVGKHLDDSWQPGRGALVAVGNVDHEEVVAAAEAHFGGLGAPGERAWHESYYMAGDIWATNLAISQTYMEQGLEGPHGADDDALCCGIISELMGEWKWSQGQYGASTWPGRISAYCKWNKEIKTEYITFSDTGLLLFRSRTNVEPWNKAQYMWSTIRQNFREFVRMQRMLLPEEFEAAKTMKIAALSRESGNSVEDYADEIGKHFVLYGRHVELPEIATRINSMHTDHAMQVFDKYFYYGDVLLSAMGKLTYLPEAYATQWWTHRVRD